VACYYPSICPMLSIVLLSSSGMRLLNDYDMEPNQPKQVSHVDVLLLVAPILNPASLIYHVPGSSRAASSSPCQFKTASA
jgi:hypothetical protein